MQEYLKKIRDYEIKIRKSVHTQIQGNFYSIYKGSGLMFDDIRLYQYGDDTRHIHWNATAKGEGTFIKTFKEEREQRVLFLIDVSASQDIGKVKSKKIDLAKELCGVLALSAIRQNSSVGFIAYSDTCELYRKPHPSHQKLYQNLGDLYYLKPKSDKTNLAQSLHYALQMCHTKHLIIMISDFIDDGYQKVMKSMMRKHDVVVLQIFDRMEKETPSLGIVPVYEVEQKKTIWINTSFGGFRDRFSNVMGSARESLKDLCKKNDTQHLSVQTGVDYIPELISFFHARGRR